MAEQGSVTTAPPPPPGYLPVAKWRLLDVVIVFAAGFVGAILATSIVLAVGADPTQPFTFSLVFFAQSGASFVFAWWLSKRRGSGSLAADLGLIVRGRDWWGVPAGMVVQVVISLLTMPLIVWLFPDGPPQQGVSEIAGQSKTMFDQLAVFIAVAVAAPIVEEVIFRGMLLSALARRMPKWPAIVVSAAVFGAVHLLDPNAIAVVPGLFLVGVVLAWAAMRSGDLSLPIALHSGINLFAAIGILYGDQLMNWYEQQATQLEGVIRFFM